MELNLHNGIMEANLGNFAYRAIEKNPLRFWRSQTKPPNSTFVAMIWYTFKNVPRVPLKISFMPVQAATGLRFEYVHDWTPSKWQFVGSNDEDCSSDGNWQVLCEDQSGQKIQQSIWEAGKEIRSCEVKWEKLFVEPKMYRCLGIKVLGTSIWNNKYFAALHRLRIWGQVDNGCP